MRWLAVLVLLLTCEAYRILLVFPVPSTSHANLGEGFVRHLLNDGHHVTYITPILIEEKENLRQIDVSSNSAHFPTNELLDLTKLMNKEIPSLAIDNVMELVLGLTNATVFHPGVQQLIQDPKEDFDVVIADWIFIELYCGFAAVFNCPMIWSSPMETHNLALSMMAEDPNPAYVISFTSTKVPPLDFRERVQGLWAYLSIKYHKWLTSLEEAPIYEAAFSSAMAVRGRQLPPYHEVQYNASLMFGNTHASLGSAVSLPQSYVPIAGHHIDENVKPLPKDLQKVMDNAKHGVIFFSMGSILRSQSMPAKLKRELLEMFSQLEQTVIWKLEESEENLPENVHLVGFAPQQSILAHPNCILFITHGGLLSNIETLHFAVPIIGVPVFADQFVNVDRAVQKGYAKRVDLDYDMPRILKSAIEDMLVNPRYSERAKELSFVFRDRAASAARALTHAVRLVARTRGAPHLRSPALLLPRHQNMYLDLLALVLLVVIFTWFLLKCALSSKKIDVKKKQT